LPRKRADLKSFGFAAVVVDEDVAETMVNITSHRFNGVRFTVVNMHKRPRFVLEADNVTATTTQVIVKDIDISLTKEQIHENFSRFGEISYLQLDFDAFKKQNRGFCLIHYTTGDAIDRAISMSRLIQVGNTYPLIYSSKLSEEVRAHQAIIKDTHSVVVKNKEFDQGILNTNDLKSVDTEVLKKCNLTVDSNLKTVSNVPMFVYRDRHVLGAFCSFRTKCRNEDFQLGYPTRYLLNSIYRHKIGLDSPFQKAFRFNLKEQFAYGNLNKSLIEKSSKICMIRQFRKIWLCKKSRLTE